MSHPIEFKESERIDQKVGMYDWDILEQFGLENDIKEIVFTIGFQYIDFVSSMKDEMLNWWKGILKRSSHPFLIARGVMKEKEIQKIKDKYLEKEKNDVCGRQIYLLPVKEVYGIFSKTLY